MNPYRTDVCEHENLPLQFGSTRRGGTMGEKYRGPFVEVGVLSKPQKNSGAELL